MKQLMVIFLPVPFASAQSGGQAEAETLGTGLVTLTQLSSFVDANVEFCQSAAPDTVPAVTRAADAWYSSSGLTVLTTIKSTMSGIGNNLKETADALEEDGSLRFRLEVDTTDLTDCYLVGPTLSEPPEAVLARAENIETYLRDPKFTHPLPEGAGELSGRYSGSNQPIYFLPEGYFHQGRLHWDYDILKDVCNRVGQPGGPVCETYVINGDTITLSYWDDADYSADDDVPVILPFSREGEGVRIGDDAYFPVAPAQDARFDGIYSYRSGDFLGGVGYKVALTPEGDFQSSEDAFVNSAFLAATFRGSNYNEGSYSMNGYTLTLHLAGELELSYNFYLDPENPDGFYLLGNPYTLGRKLQ